MSDRLHSIVETPGFARDAKAAGLSETERREIITAYANNPVLGEEMEGTGGARKARFAGRGKGKRGGYRVISYYAGPDVPLFLFNLFSKGDKANLSKAERNELRDVLSELAAEYRKGVRNHVQSRQPHPRQRP